MTDKTDELALMVIADTVNELDRRLSKIEEQAEPLPKIRFRTVMHGTPPRQAHANDAGWDLHALVGVVLPVGAIRLVPTGTFIDQPPETFGMICSRSGLVAKHGVAVANAPGIIDADYRGEVMVSLVNLGGAPYHIDAGDRIAQVVFGRHDLVVVAGGSTLGSGSRGDGGHGSSGR